MALKVIGSGLGRTGTKSLQTALNMLGVGPCHHMVEVFMHPERIPLWIAAGAGKPDWDAIFDGYQSTVDYPSAAFWRELAAYYPDAKVLHSTRDPEAWFESTQATIFSPDSPGARALRNGEEPILSFMRAFMGDIADCMHDRSFMIDHFRRHDDAVRTAIPSERLLVFEAEQGWAPLCAFLGVAVPDAPYPSENKRGAAFDALVAGLSKPD
jgi:hypothetical protein